MEPVITLLVHIVFWVLIIGALLYVLHKGLGLWEVEPKVAQFIELIVLLLLIICVIYYVPSLRMIR